MARIVVTDIDKCVACRTCEIVCATAHSQSRELDGAVTESPPPQERLQVAMDEGVISLHRCNQCDDAPCIESCAKDAITRDENTGIVVLNAELCIGCQLCIKACPHDAMFAAREGRIPVKCDVCTDRIQVGEEPACVVSCPTGVMKFLEDEKKEI